MIEGQLGKGGMGIVLLATEMSLQRQVALKVLPLSMNSDDTFCQRFLVEARAAAALNHPNIVRVYAVGRDAETGRLYLSMEYIEGQTLDEVMGQNERLSFGNIIHVARSVASGLEHAWDHKIVHRDIKPNNIMLGARKHVTILDFGLAKVRHTGSGLTMPGVIIGSPEYMSPEQSEGNELDVRSDLYSLGVVMYEMLGGDKPFASNTPAGLIHLHAFANPRSIRAARENVPQELEDVLCRLLAKNPADRYESPAALIADLDLVEDLLRAEDRLEEAPEGLTVLPVGFSQPGKIDTTDALDLTPRNRALTKPAPPRSRWPLRMFLLLLLAACAAGLAVQQGWWRPLPPPSLDGVAWEHPRNPWPYSAEPREGSAQSRWITPREDQDLLTGAGTGFLRVPLGEGYWRFEGRLLPSQADLVGIYVEGEELPGCGLVLLGYDEVRLLALELTLPEAGRARARMRRVEADAELSFAVSIAGRRVRFEVDSERYAEHILSTPATHVALYVDAPQGGQGSFAGLALQAGGPAEP